MRRKMTREQQRAMFARLGDGYTPRKNRTRSNRGRNISGKVNTATIHTGRIGDKKPKPTIKHLWEGDPEGHSEAAKKGWEGRKKPISFKEELKQGWIAVRRGSDTEYTNKEKDRLVVLTRYGPGRCSVRVGTYTGAMDEFFTRSNMTEDEAEKVAQNHIRLINTGLE